MHSQYIVKGNLQRNIIASTPISLRRQLVPLNVIKSGTQMHRGTEVGRCNVIFIWSQNTEVLIYTVNNAQMLTTVRLLLFSNTHTLTVWAQPSRNVHIPDVACNFHTHICLEVLHLLNLCVLMLRGCSTYTQVNMHLVLMLLNMVVILL